MSSADSTPAPATIRSGLDHLRAGRWEQARAAFQQAAALTPDDPAAHVLLAQSLERLDQLEPAIESLRRALQLAPANLDAMVGLAILLRRTGQLEEALTVADRAAAIAPDDSNAADIRANLLADLRREDEALAIFDATLAGNSRDARAHVGRARVLLTRGNLIDGFREYEWRFLMTGAAPADPRPRWDGSDPSGRTILIRAEQGLGDTIQMIRYAPILADRGAKLFVLCQPTLVELLTSLRGISLVRPLGAPLPPYDLWTPAMSLPYCFKSTLQTIPRDVPYLRADLNRIEKFKDVVAEANHAAGLKVGLAWSGQPAQTQNRNRSCPPAALAPLAALAELTEHGAIALFSLQKPPAPELPPQLKSHVTDLSPRLTDMSDTAAAMMHLDLILSVDTAIAHLAGALGRPVWTMLAYAPDWRYLLDRPGSPWYPTMRCWRPTRPGGWDQVVADVSRALKDFAHP